MTNGEKYKNAKERAEAFSKYAKPLAPRNEYEFAVCAFEWLDLEAPEEKPLLCPFCGHEVKVGEIDNEKKEAVEFYIHCEGCHITTMDYATREELLSVWNNRVARAAKEANDANAK